VGADRVAELKRLYYNATERSIRRDVETAIDIFKTLRTEEERERAAVYMDGLSQMRSEWAKGSSGGQKQTRRSGVQEKTSKQGDQEVRRKPRRSFS
jgi:hypothetical protein